MSFAVIAVATVGAAVIGAGAEIYSSDQQHSIEEQQLGLANTQAGKQNLAFNQLQQLINDPSSFFSSPVYTAAANQGGAQVARQMASGGFRDSGNEATALQAYGQTFGQQQLLSQEQLLANMSGVGFNPAGALSGASGSAAAATGSLNSLAGILAFFGSSGAGSGGGSTGNPSAGFTGTDLNPVTVGDTGVIPEG
jgi:hypothetical protein